MSRAFVKDTDGDVYDALPDLPLSEHINYVTPSGIAKLRARLEQTLARRDALADQHEALAEQNELLSLARDLRWLNARLACVVEVDLNKQPRNRVAFGATVTVEDNNGNERRWQIVGENEADAEHGLVSYVSPLAQALLGARVGDAVRWVRPAGDITLEVVAIDY